MLGAAISLPSPALADDLAETSPPSAEQPTTDAPPYDPAPTEPADPDVDPSVDPGTADTPEPDPTAEPPADPPADDSIASGEGGDPTPAPQAAAVVDGVGFTVDHAWIDPRVLNTNGRPSVSVTMVFPAIDPSVHTVAHGSAPSGLAQISHCSITRPEEGTTTITCDFLGDIRPGESTITARIRSEAGHDYQATVPVTMCLLTGCSPLFEVAAVQEAAISACPSAAFTVEGVFDFNVAWNATAAAVGAGAPAGLSLTADGLRDGSSFRLAGVIDQPGEVSIPIVVTDEFGSTHETRVLVTVLSPGTPPCPSLAATGASVISPAVGLGAIAMLLAGILGLQLAGRPTTLGRRHAAAKV